MVEKVKELVLAELVVVNQLRWQGIIETPRNMDYSHFNLKEMNLATFLSIMFI